METKHIIINTKDDSEGINEVAEILRSGGIVAIPTETVYGLAADATNVEAVRKVFIAKGRPQDNPLIVHISDYEMLLDVVSEVPFGAKELSALYWPGPLTVIMPKSDNIPDEVCAGLSTVAVRMPSNDVARAIISKSGLPLAAPSANLSGKPSPTTAQHCIDDLDGLVDAIVISSPCSVGVESTVVTLTTQPPKLLRPGYVTKEQIESILPDLVVDKAVTAEPKEGEKVASPGMKYKHYSPSTKVVLVTASVNDYIDFVNSKENAGALCFDDESESVTVPYLTYGDSFDDASQANRIFDVLHKVDQMGVEVVYVHTPDKSGIGLAVYNRLIRAAAFNEIVL